MAFGAGSRLGAQKLHEESLLHVQRILNTHIEQIKTLTVEQLLTNLMNLIMELLISNTYNFWDSRHVAPDLSALGSI